MQLFMGIFFPGKLHSVVCVNSNEPPDSYFQATPIKRCAAVSLYME